MKALFSALRVPCFVALSQIAAMGEVVDFNSLSSLDSAFVNLSYSGGPTLVDVGGFGGSRGLVYDDGQRGGRDVHAFTSVAFSPKMEEWEVSILFRSDKPWELGNPMIGVMGGETVFGSPPPLNAPYHEMASLFATAQSNSLDLFGAYGFYEASANVIPVYDGLWRKFSMRVEHAGTTANVIESYNIHVVLSYSDEAGGAGPLIARIDQQYRTAQFQSTHELYPFFGIDAPNHFSGAIDNFAVSVPEPAVVGLVGVGAVLLWRSKAARRKCRP